MELYYSTPMIVQYAERGDVASIRNLLDRRSPFSNEVTKESMKEALFAAFKIGQIEIVKLLLERGTEANIKDEFGRTPLHLALQNGCLSLVKYLIYKGAEVNSKDDCKRTPLHYAAANNQIDVLRYLTDKKADVEAKDKDRVSGLCSDAPYFFVVMEYCAYGSLKETIYDTRRHIEAGCFYKWKKEIAEGVYYLHSNHLLHCNLNPSNILIDDTNTVKISDICSSSNLRELNISGSCSITLGGAPAYMAPEVLLTCHYSKKNNPEFQQFLKDEKMETNFQKEIEIDTSKNTDRAIGKENRFPIEKVKAEITKISSEDWAKRLEEWNKYVKHELEKLAATPFSNDLDESNVCTAN
ncbi:unnamed protein product [Enterobius vermicularis]|uniref:Protein kinase domain-containing protein n=1 Tax=Enterobius vermicularis TaxID=51028 RepID=A0A0N4UVB5_ENTVE|nr:unnamed protein product [Enterobius vermicularis]